MQKEKTDQTAITDIDGYKKITYEDLWGEAKTFKPKSITGLRSTESGLSYTSIEDKKKIVRYSYETGEMIDTLFDAASVKGKLIKEIDAYELSKDETRIVLATKSKRIYRHSFTAKHYIWDIESGTLTRLSDRPSQRLATFSPDGSKVAFISRNDLYIKDLLSGEETRITDDGRMNNIINGAADWVYEEEFALKRAFEWSPESDRIAYLRFDESKVKQFTMLRYEGGYPKKVVYKYPRAGEKNSVVSVYVYDLKKAKSVRVDVGDETDQYIPRIKWTKAQGQLAVLRVNRLQNRLDYLLCDAADGKSGIMHTELNDRYLDVDDSLTFLDDNKGFIITSERNGWRHIYLCGIDGDNVRPITNGDWDVSEYHGYSEANGRVYFTAARPNPMRRTLYSIKLDGSEEQQLSRNDGANAVSFSKGLHYYINTFSNPTTPPILTLHTSDGKQVRVLEDNSALAEIVKSYKTSVKNYVPFKTSEGVELVASLVKPADFDPKKQYPLIMMVYGGPNSGGVEGWEFGWERYLAQEGYIVAIVEGRGTGSRGEEFRKCTYQELGKLETVDQIESAKYLGSLPYVDASRIGIFGWSYGGFMACSCILRGADVFKAAIAVASVTNFRYYDTIYTERYMRTPQENPKGYDDNAPLAFAENLKGKLLLVHGVTDDNVHCQNSMELIEALVKASKQFEVHFLPNRDHGIGGGNTHLHLFPRMTEFLFKNL